MLLICKDSCVHLKTVSLNGIVNDRCRLVPRSLTYTHTQVRFSTSCHLTKAAQMYTCGDALAQNYVFARVRV